MNLDHDRDPPRDHGVVLTDLRVCFVGDSFVAGAGDPEHLGWAGRLAARTHRAGRELTSYNLGVRRQTSEEVAARWLGECSSRFPVGCEARVVVSFGVNDTTLESGHQRVDVAGSARSMAAVVAGAGESGWAVLVVGPPPVADAGQNARTAVHDEAFGRVCAAAGVPYVSTLAALGATPVWRDQVAAGDGAHPGAQGYAAMAAVVWPAWWSWLAPPPPA